MPSRRNFIFAASSVVLFAQAPPSVSHIIDQAKAKAGQRAIFVMFDASW